MAKRRDEGAVLLWRPTSAQLEAARNKRLRDVIAPGLSVLFCGINPSLYSAAVGHHFARPGNRFWPALHQSGFTPRLFSAFEDADLLQLGYGVTNLVPRATAQASELTRAEILLGRKGLERKLRRYRPAMVAFLGVGAYRLAFESPKASLGQQPECLGATKVWVLPNPSGLNAHHQLQDLVVLFEELRRAVGAVHSAPTR